MTTQKPKRHGKDNLRDIRELTTEEQREFAMKGAEKSAEVRKEKKQVKELLETMFESKAPEDLKAKFQVLFPNITIQKLEDILNLAMIKKIVKGDVQAYNAIYDRKEGKPKQETDITTNGEIRINLINYTENIKKA